MAGADLLGEQGHEWKKNSEPQELQGVQDLNDGVVQGMRFSERLQQPGSL